MFKSAITVFLLLSIAFSHEDFPKEDGVLVLSDNDFDHALEHHPTMLVEFYAPWCGHCKSLAPEYAKAAQKLAGTDLQVKLAKVDTTVNKKLGEKYDIKGFPTLKWFKDGEVLEYSGGRTEQTIVNWITKKVGSQSTLVNSSEELEKSKAQGVTVAYFGGDNKKYETFLKAAEKFDDIRFVHSFSSELKEQLSASELTLYKSFDELVNHYSGDFSLETVAEFIETNSIPTIMGFDQKTAEVVFQNQKNAVFLLHGTSEDENVHALAAFEEASKTLKGKILMSQTQVAEGFGQRLGEFLGVKPEDGPVCVIIKFEDENIKKYFMSEKAEVRSILKFFEDFTSGSLKQALKSEEIPASQEEAVVVLVGKSFPSIVYDETKDVLVEFYAPWCGHCKTLAPKYEELAQKLKLNKNIVIAKMDSTQNEVEGVNVKGFPTIKLYRRGQKQNPIDYSGEREVEDMLTFLKKQTEFEEGVESTESKIEDL